MGKGYAERKIYIYKKIYKIKMQGGFAVQATAFCVHAGHTHTRHQL